jgi:hypothetical protein
MKRHDQVVETPTFSSRYSRFDYRPGGWLFWMRIFVVLFCTSRQILEQSVKTDHDCLPSQFIIRCYTRPHAVDKTSLNKLRKKFLYNVRSEVYKAMKMWTVVFWIVTPCNHILLRWRWRYTLLQKQLRDYRSYNPKTTIQISTTLIKDGRREPAKKDALHN